MFNFNILILLIASLSLSSTYLLTTFTLIIRSFGALNNLNAKSFNLSSFILMFNSFTIAISLSLIALMVDRQSSLKLITYLFLMSTLLITFGHFFLILKFKLIIKFIQKLFKIYFKFNNFKNFDHRIKYNNIDFIGLLSWIFLLLGFIFPTYLASFFYEYRTTCFQFSFIFNSVGTILSVIYVDKKISIYGDDNLDLSKSDIIVSFLSRVLVSRFLSSLLIFINLIFFFIIFIK